MEQSQDNQFNKEACDLKHEHIKDKFGEIDTQIKDNAEGLKANIKTSKESLSVRLDEVDAALLGDRTDPGGLLRDIREMEKDIQRHKKEVDKEVQTQNFKMKLCLLMCILIVGGKIMGFGLNNIVDYFKPTPVVSPAPEKEKLENIPIEIEKNVKEILKENSSTVEDK